jgi:putative phosphoesterase
MGKDEAVLFISDVHSNIEALEAVLNGNREMKVYCLGDVVGYGASPNEVVDILQEREATMVLGNHDVAALTANAIGFNSRAAIAAIWNSRQLSDENRHFLAGLPRERTVMIAGQKVYMTHGSPDDNLWEYVFQATHSDLFGFYLEKLSVDVIALGHTHVPFVWSEREGTVFNPGSVGQPREGDPRASYAILTVKDGKVRVENRRKEYDIEASAKKIIDADLPESLAKRLFIGQ